MRIISSENVTETSDNAEISTEEEGEEGIYEGLSDYKEEKNHSEAIQRILRDFEKTLEENKKIFDIAEGLDQKPREGLEEKGVVTIDIEVNATSEASVDGEVADNSTKTRLVCNNTLTLDEPNSTPIVHLLNGSFYQISLAEEFNSSVSNRSQPATCSLTLFFASWCDFSASAAPHYNALARVFPQLKLYAVDSSMHHSLNTQYGVMAVPTLLVFHNSRPLYKYNYTEYSLASFTTFVSLLTGLEPQNVTEPNPEDWEGPVPSVAVKSHNYYLLLAFLFTVLCGLREFSKSPLAGQLVDTLRNAWREAEIQHEHTE
jgi:thiol-disulfide isomerase/thioredoxin